MKILGVRHGHDSAAALIIDGEIVADVAEERFTRVKNDTSFPIKAIQYCLEAGNITSEDIDCLTIPTTKIPPSYFTFFKIPKAAIPIKVSKKKKLINTILGNSSQEDDLYVPPVSQAQVPVLPLYQEPFILNKKCKIHLVEHHLAHASTACFTSGLYEEKATVVTMDGIGDNVSVAIWRFHENKIEPIKKIGSEGSLGWFYANATEGMGWKHGSDEWKLMGLAPYGQPRPGALNGFHPEFENGELKRPHDYGSYGRWNDHGCNHYHSQDAKPLSKIFKNLGPEDYAAEVQRISEEQALNIIVPWLAKENSRTLLCAGGFFLNVKFNQKLWYSDLLDYHWVYPNPGDASLAVGSALHFHYSQNRSQRCSKMQSHYHGPEYHNEEIKKILDDRGIAYKYLENPSKEAAKYLHKNCVLGWFQGRMETGPRALGNRSILMSPLRAENKDIINHKIKYREHFRPFAPAMPTEKANEYLIKPREELFMTCSFEVKDEKQDKIPAVVHHDNTARPQMVKRELNSRYYDLIMEFGNLTGEYVILNTSFNVKGEPIVQHPREAIKCFYDTGMDVLIIGNFLIKKAALSNP